MSGSSYFGGVYGGGTAEGGAAINRVQNLQDNFNDNSLDLTKWVNWGDTQVVESSQTLRMTLATTNDYMGINSVSDYTLIDSYAYIQLVSPGNTAIPSYEIYPVFLQILGDEDNVVYWLVSGGLKVAYKKVAGVDYILDSSPYNSTTDKWFRIRESVGTTYWDTSTDGISWTNNHQEANPIDYSSLEPNVFIGKWDPDDTSVTTAVFDNFNVGVRMFSIDGTFILSGVVDPEVNHFSDISGTFHLSGGASGFIQPILQTAGTKTFEYKVYDPETGDFLGRWDDVVSEFSYSQEINSGGSAIDIVLARNSDSLVRGFNPLATDDNESIITDNEDEIAAEVTTANAIGPGTTVDLNLDVKVYVFPEGGDLDDIEGTLIFTGYISKYVTRYGREENTIVTLFSYGAELDNWVLEASGNTRVQYLSYDPSDILKDALDKFNAEGGIPSYDQGGTTIDDTSTTVTYTFNVNTMLEVIKKCLELAPTDWYWYYDMALNNVHFHAKGITPDHTFVLGKHILELNLEKYIEDITNLVYFTGGPQNPFVSDTFTGTDGTNLTAHTGTVGATWTKHPLSHANNEIVITNANRVRSSSPGFAEGNYIASGQSLSSDMTVEADFYVASWTGDFGLTARVNPTVLTYYLGLIYPADNKVRIWRCIAGSFTNIGEANYSNPGTGTTHHVELKVEGAEISVIIDGDTYVRATDTSIPTGNLGGLRGVSDESNTTGLHYDNFQISSQANQNVNLFKKYENASSISNFRRGLQRVNDNRVKLETSADIIVESIMNRGSSPRYRSSIRIADKVYNIETIRLGQIVAFRNFGNYVDDVMMQIVRIDYHPDYVQLQLDTLLPSVPKRLEDVKRNLNLQETENNPDAPLT